MKRISSIAIFTFFTIVGCTKEVETNNEDCNCNRVQSHTKYNLPGGDSYGEYVTINDCSGVQTNGNWNTSWGDEEPINGSCL